MYGLNYTTFCTERKAPDTKIYIRVEKIHKLFDSAFAPRTTCEALHISGGHRHRVCVIEEESITVELPAGSLHIDRHYFSSIFSAELPKNRFTIDNI